MEYKNLFTPMNIGNVTIKNRVVMPAMMLGHGKFDGTPTEQMMDYYEKRAEGGTGLIITEIARVNDLEGAAAFAQLAVSQDYHIKPLAEMVNRIHKHDCRIFVQLQHPGRQGVPLAIGTLPIAIPMEHASRKLRDGFYAITPAARKLQDAGIVLPVAAPSKTAPCRYQKGRNRALTKFEIHRIIGQFGDAARRVQLSGADGVELHAAHGYLIQQFLSPNTNHRTDEYGGSFDNRMRFVLEIIQDVQNKCGKDFPIIVRLSADECYDKIGEPERGYHLEDGVEIAKCLEKAGVAAINVSSANYETMNYWLEPTSFEPGWRKYMAKAVKDAVSIPVIAANVIRSPEQAETQIAEGYQDFVALGRPHIADPYWVKKVETGCEKDIKRCISCLWCFESMQANAYEGTAGTCAVNPRMGREKIFENMAKDGNGRKVVVVGAGPAGLTAAEILSERGFDVTVLEKEERAGGQAYLASLPPHKQRLYWCIEDLVQAATSKGAEIKYGVEATDEIISSYNPYSVIIASGSVALKPRSIKGIDGKNVCTYTEILKDEIKPKKKTVALIGSGMTGLETAEKVAEAGNKVIVVEMADTIAPNTHSQHVDDILPRLKEMGVSIITSAKLEEITDHSIIMSNTANGRIIEKDIDLCVMSLGVKAVTDLYKSIEGKYNHLYLIGDAASRGRIANATHSAAEIALNLH